ncbi:autorepressor SdpR family transcription factor [Gelria sp. Kuro-4]|jgi:DNA-binding transcriptional ArsR family regulator|uniref:autorepressor SdpR family transcription factor n=1 Tax=Gelria sp. Kuro-4 TaxID=2796927 RepID=UPI001C7F18F0
MSARGREVGNTPFNLVFKALADGTRRRILELLREKDLTAGEIAAHFAISKPSISHHLGILKQANLVSDERQGQNIVYSLNTTVFQEALAWLLELAGTGMEDGPAPPKNPLRETGDRER